MPHPLPLNKRIRRLNLFDQKLEGLEGINYIEDVLSSKINMISKTQHEAIKNVHEFCLLTLLTLNSLKMKKEEFSENDYLIRRTIICITKSHRKPNLYEFNCKISTFEFGYKIVFERYEDADKVLLLCDSEYVFFRPKNFIEMPFKHTFFGNKGNKYCREVPITKDKILIGPLNIEEDKIVEALEFIGELQCYRKNIIGFQNNEYKIDNHKQYEKESYSLAFTFQNRNLTKPFIEIMSHIILQGTPLIVKRAYEDCKRLDFSYMTPHVVPKHLTGVIVCSKIKTKVIQILNIEINKFKKNLKEEIEKIEGVISFKIPTQIDTGPMSCVKCPGEGKIFVEFDCLKKAVEFYLDIGGRSVGGRTVICTFYPEENYKLNEFE